MKLLTKEIIKQATAQYHRGSSMNQMCVAKFFDPTGSGTWYLMNLDKDLDYAWGIAKISEVEMGSWLMSDLQSYRRLGLGIERDLYFKPMRAQELWDKLQRGEHV